MSAAVHEIRLRGERGDIAALRGGDPGGSKLLCLHGWLDNAASFLPMAPHLDTFDWVAPELPGHGASAHRADGHDYAFVDWIHDALDIADALGWDRPDWLGHSMGGAIAAVVAAAAPQRVRRLALIESLGPIAGDPGKAAERLRAAVDARRARAARPPRRIPSLETAVTARLAAGRMPEDAATLIVSRNLREVDGGFMWRSDPRLMLPSATRMPEAAVHALLRAIEAPVLLVAAEPPPPYFDAATRAARLACIPGARVEIFDAGHHLHMEQPGRVAALLAEFLGS